MVAPRHFVIALLCLLGLGLRLTGLDIHSLWGDEGATLFVANADDIVAALRKDRHPPLSFLFFRAWLAVVPQTDVMVRLLPALASSLALLLFVPLARAWLPTPAAIWAIGIFAVAPVQIWFGQEVRMYSFVGCAAIVALLGADWIVREQPRVLAGTLFAGVGVAIALGCHYLGVVTAGTVSLIGVLAWLHGRRRGAWLIAASVLGCAVWLPWIFLVVPGQMAQPAGFLARATLRDLAELPVREIVVMGAAMPTAIPLAIAAGTWLGLLGLAWRLVRRRTLTDQLICCAIVGPPLGALVLALAMPLVFRPNYLIMMAPGVALGVARGLHVLVERRRWLHLVPWLFVAVCLTASLFLRRENLRDDYRSAVGELVAAWQPGDRVVTVIGPPQPTFEATVRHYLQGHDEVAASLVGIEGLLQELESGKRVPGRLHVVFLIRAWTTPLLDRLERHYKRTHAGEMRYWVQHLILQ